MKEALPSAARQLIDLLAPLAAQIDPPHPYWLNPDDGACEDFCYECINKRIAELAESEPDVEYTRDGGWGGQESDSPVWCAGCGCLLTYWPTDHGTKDELDHWAEHAAVTTPEDAWQLDRLINTGVPILTETCGDHTYMPEARPVLRKILRRFLKDHPPARD